jgi:hypothetical protein
VFHKVPILVPLYIMFSLMICFIADQCDMFNYADDNSICCHGNNVDDVITNLEKVSNVMITWFNIKPHTHDGT